MVMVIGRCALLESLTGVAQSLNQSFRMSGQHSLIFSLISEAEMLYLVTQINALNDFLSHKYGKYLLISEWGKPKNPWNFISFKTASHSAALLIE